MIYNYRAGLRAPIKETRIIISGASRNVVAPRKGVTSDRSGDRSRRKPKVDGSVTRDAFLREILPTATCISRLQLTAQEPHRSVPDASALRSSLSDGPSDGWVPGNYVTAVLWNAGTDQRRDPRSTLRAGHEVNFSSLPGRRARAGRLPRDGSLISSITLSLSLSFSPSLRLSPEVSRRGGADRSAAMMLLAGASNRVEL